MRILLLVIVGVLVLSVGAMAWREEITKPTGEPVGNEVINGHFENDLGGWDFQEGDVAWSDFGVSDPPPDGNHSAMCNKNTEGWGDRMRQVIDDSRADLWDWNLHSKVIDLEAWISIDTKAGNNGGVRFRLDYWDERYNALPQPPSTTEPGYHVTDWVSYTKYATGEANNHYGFGTNWAHVNPFNLLQLEIQPRWISVEIEFLQPANTINRVDAVALVSKCVPEPSMIASLLAGFVGLGATRLRRKK